jgi:hypothetical protein
LPYLVTEELRKNANLFFLQIGANDGVFCDPLHDLVLRHNLSGLLVEPLRNLFERLRANYAGQPGIRLSAAQSGGLTEKRPFIERVPMRQSLNGSQVTGGAPFAACS